MKIGSRKKMRSSSAKLSSLAPQCVSHGKKKKKFKINFFEKYFNKLVFIYASLFRLDILF